MKYLLPIILMALSMSAHAESEYEKALRSKIICEDGYKYLIVWVESGSWRPPSVVQMKEASGTSTRSVPQPIKCN